MSFATFQLPVQGIEQRWGATRALVQMPIRMAMFKLSEKCKETLNFD